LTPQQDYNPQLNHYRKQYPYYTSPYTSKVENNSDYYKSPERNVIGSVSPRRDICNLYSKFNTSKTFEKNNFSNSDYRRSPGMSTNVSSSNYQNNVRDNLSPRRSTATLSPDRVYDDRGNVDIDQIRVRSNYNPNSTSRSKMNFSPGRTYDSLKYENNVRNPFTESQSNQDINMNQTSRSNQSDKFTSKQQLSSKHLSSSMTNSRLGEKKPSTSSAVSPGNTGNPVDPYKFNFLSLEEEAFQDFLREIIILGSEIELAKSDLALRPDFNLSDCFRIFETNKLEYISDLDFKYGLNFLDLFPLMEELHLVFNHYKTKGQKLLS